MGQSYFVSGKFNFRNNDPRDFCKAIKDYINEHNKKDCTFRESGIENVNLDDPFVCFTAVCPESEKKSDNEYAAWFDASYGWYSVMFDIFKKALEFCEDGSEVIIEPDGDATIIYKENGTVCDADYETEDDRLVSKIVDWIIENERYEGQDGEVCVPYDLIADEFEIEKTEVEDLEDSIYEELLDRKEVADVGYGSEAFDVYFYEDDDDDPDVHYTIWGSIKPSDCVNIDDIRKVIDVATAGRATVEEDALRGTYTVKGEFDASPNYEEDVFIEAVEPVILNHTDAGSFIEIMGSDWTTRYEIRSHDLASQIAAYITQEGCVNTDNGSYVVYFDEIAEHFGITEEEVSECAEEVTDILDYEVVADVEVDDECFDMVFYLAFCGVEEDDEE